MKRFTERSRRGCAAGLATACALAWLASSHTAEASSFSVSPTQIFLTRTATSRLITLRNESDRLLRFQLTAFKWDQGTDGQMKLDPTTDVVFFPTLLSLGPKEEKKVRIGAVTPFAVTEKTYRIFIQELPPAADAGPAVGVAVLTRLGIPIFMRPAKEVAQATLKDLSLEDRTFSFALANTGSVHFLPERIVVSGAGRNGEQLFAREINAWYVLAGGTRVFEAQFDQAECERLAALAVEVKISGSVLKERLEISPAACKTTAGS